jgi:hypothetical protein
MDSSYSWEIYEKALPQGGVACWRRKNLMTSRRKYSDLCWISP